MTAALATTQALVDRALDQVNRHAGLVFKDVRLAGAIETVVGWLAEQHIAAVEQIGPGLAFDELLAELVVHESYFDRDREQLALVDELALEPFLHNDAELRVWSAGCASGEEPYTLAFMLATRGLLPRARILATDLSAPALRRAREGRYRPWAVRTGAATPARRFLIQDGHEWRVPPTYKRAVRFELLNLIEDPYPRSQDLIVCRNVLIYLAPSAIEVVAAKLAAALSPTGWLFVAPSDPRLDLHAPLAATVTDRGVYYRPGATTPRIPPKPAAAIARPPTPAPDAPRGPALVRPSEAPPAAPIEAARPPIRDHVRALADRGDEAGARDALAAAIAATPLDAELHFLDAVLRSADDIPGALEALDRATYLQPEAPVSYLFAGRLRQSTGDVAGARRAYRRALEILERLAPAERVVWSDEPAWIMTDACRRALEAIA